jgi:hypothetical protein
MEQVGKKVTEVLEKRLNGVPGLPLRLELLLDVLLIDQRVPHFRNISGLRR